MLYILKTFLMVTASWIRAKYQRQNHPWRSPRRGGERHRRARTAMRRLWNCQSSAATDHINIKLDKTSPLDDGCSFFDDDQKPHRRAHGDRADDRD
jgi:hypothetical protein